MPRTQTSDVLLGVIEEGPLRFELGIVDRRLAWRSAGAIVTLRNVVGALEDYNPAVDMTRAAVDEYGPNRAVKVHVSRREVREVLTSQVVLNRGLREAFLASGLKPILVAARCGRVRGGRRDKERKVGDVSWLSRRLGIVPNYGESEPTPWVHTDVLALIAREGLGVAPREVEVVVDDD
jgi:hypothetical protein